MAKKEKETKKKNAVKENKETKKVEKTKETKKAPKNKTKKVKKNETKKVPKESYFEGVKSEMSKVKWPTKKEVFKYTVATITFVLILVGFFLLMSLVMSVIKGAFN